MLHNVIIFKSALLEIDDIGVQIYNVSRNKQTAYKYLDYIYSAIISLQIFPLRFAVRIKNYHTLQVKDYFIFYKVNEQKKEVVIHKVA